MSNLIKQGVSGQTIEHLGSIKIDESLKVKVGGVFVDVVTSSEKDDGKITVATYADAVPFFAGDAFKTIYVESDTQYNEGDPSFYTYHPTLGVAFLGLDFNYIL